MACAKLDGLYLKLSENVSSVLLSLNRPALLFVAPTTMCLRLVLASSAPYLVQTAALALHSFVKVVNQGLNYLAILHLLA